MTRRADLLASDLGQVVHESNIKTAWKHSVRTGLRNQVLPDIHDHLDLHRNQVGIASRLASDVSAGRYRPATPEFITLEKKDGIARRMAIPDPEDALVLQCIVDTLESQLKPTQPTRRAYYSRSHAPPDVERIDGTFAYPWWKLWPEFQERILQFAATHDFIVVTDIANYFDTIPLTALRNTIAGLAQISENVLNLLFFVLESLVWRPYFMPHSGVGLPQLNFDAPRLLAHAYLFKVDQELEHLTSGAFVRWMDDIDAGVKSPEAGKVLLRATQQVLNSQGLQLNPKKSRIMAAPEALKHFCARHNRALTIFENNLANGSGSAIARVAAKQKLRKSYGVFRADERATHWDKVQKRYLNLFGKSGDNHAEPDLAELLHDEASMRDAVFLYLSRLGYSDHRLTMVTTFIASDHCSDDASLFSCVECLNAWRVPLSSQLLSRMLTAADVLAKKESDNPGFPFGASLCLRAKYASDEQLADFVLNSRVRWERSIWASRQVAAIRARIPLSRRSAVLKIIQEAGLTQGLRVWTHIGELQALAKLDSQLRSYLYYTSSSPFPIQRAMLARAVLDGHLNQVEKDALRSHLRGSVRDARMVAVMLSSG